jgi:glycosyltransferase involved in cell wall biosynthesis
MRDLPSESEIINGWSGDPAHPLVSISCAAYNQQAFIEDALEGFLRQQTVFPFEILIHDDASTDRTAEIIREYAETYPRIIKPVYQTENQYRKHRNVAKRFNVPRMKGKYLASCEGDDYWTDPLKLQKQFDFMEANPDFSMCFHDCRHVDIVNGTETLTPCSRDKKRVYSKDDLISLRDGIATATKFRRKLSDDDLPSILADGLTGDYPSNARYALFGPAGYVADVSPSVRRVHSGGTYSGQHPGLKLFSKPAAIAKVFRCFVAAGYLTEAEISLRALIAASLAAYAEAHSDTRRRSNGPLRRMGVKIEVLALKGAALFIRILMRIV